MAGCLLKYSDSNFFGKIDTNNGIYGTNHKFFDNPPLIQNKVDDLFNALTAHTVLGLSYAQGIRKVINKTKIFNMLECTQDLSDADCRKCLQTARRELLVHSEWKSKLMCYL